MSDRNAINDSCFKGAYIVKNSLDGYGLIDAMAYFMGSDRFSEYFDSAGLLYGGSGLVSKDGIVKLAFTRCPLKSLWSPTKSGSFAFAP